MHFEIVIEIERGGMRVRGIQRRRVPFCDDLERVRIQQDILLRTYVPSVSGSTQVLCKDQKGDRKKGKTTYGNRSYGIVT